MLALVAACNPHVQGNGIYYEENRPRGDFQGVHVEDGVQVFATSGVVLQPVRVIGDANVVPHIETEVEPEMVGTTSTQVLHVWVNLSGGYDPTITPQVVVSIPTFSYVNAENASPVQVKRAAAPVFTVKESDSARVELIGTGGDLIDATLADESLLDATAYPTGGADVDLSGRSSAKLQSNGAVIGRVLNDAVLNNLLGEGGCCVTASPSATVSCNAVSCGP